MTESIAEIKDGSELKVSRAVKFTPGPWHLCAHLKNIDKEIDCKCGYRGVIYGPEPEGYAICQPGHESHGWDGLEPPRYDRMTEIANAHLIAAAPDLYEVLELIYRQMNHWDIGYEEAKEALAKARGET